MVDLPHPFTSRPYRSGDAAAVTALYNAIEQHAGGHPGYVEDETEAVIASTVADVDTDSRLAFSLEGALVAAGGGGVPTGGGAPRGA